METLQNYLQFFLSNGSNMLGNYFTRSVNKLRLLTQAREFGFHTPDTIVTSEKKKLVHFAKKHDYRLITKPSWEIVALFNDSEQSMSYTAQIGRDEISSWPDNFFPSLFQNRIEKSYELRIFVFDHEIFPCAIFSQLGTGTTTDFRGGNENEYRTVPYSLSSKREKQILKFMDYIKMDTGSFDFIVTPDSEMVFVEINPVGQFGFTSHPCNYYIEKKLANYMIAKSNHG